jgi:hypothetical protein
MGLTLRSISDSWTLPNPDLIGGKNNPPSSQIQSRFAVLTGSMQIVVHTANAENESLLDALRRAVCICLQWSSRHLPSVGEDFE